MSEKPARSELASSIERVGQLRLEPELALPRWR